MGTKTSANIRENIASESSAEQSAPSRLQAAAMTLAVIPLIAGYLTICHLLGIHETYAGILFLLCWAATEHVKPAGLASTFLGCSFGLLLSYGLGTLSSTYGTAGSAAFGVIMLPIVYAQISQTFPQLINLSTMIFLTVLTIPHILAVGEVQDMASSLLVGLLYFGTIIALPAVLKSRRAAAD